MVTVYPLWGILLFLTACLGQGCLYNTCNTPQNLLPPVLLIPGIGGSVINLGMSQVWALALNQDSIQYYFPGTLNTSTNDFSNPKYDIWTPKDGRGLCSIVDLVSGLVSYLTDEGLMYMDMVAKLSCEGYVPLQSIRGFPYDWRQSLRSETLLSDLHDTIKNYAESSPTKTIDVVSHSMGGLLMKSYLAKYPEGINYVSNWVAIGAPWGGSADTILSLINGLSFGKLSAYAEHSLALQLPSFYELLAVTQDHLPPITYNLIGVTHEVDAHSLPQFLSEVNTLWYYNGNTHNFSSSLWANAQTIVTQLKKADDVITAAKCAGKSFNFVSIQGSEVLTPTGLFYNYSVTSVTQLPGQRPNRSHQPGDGTVPLASALTEPLSVKCLYTGSYDHRYMIRDPDLIHDVIHLLSDPSLMNQNFQSITLYDQRKVTCPPVSDPASAGPTEPASGQNSSNTLDLATILIIVGSVLAAVIMIGTIIVGLRMYKRRQYATIKN